MRGRWLCRRLEETRTKWTSFQISDIRGNADCYIKNKEWLNNDRFQVQIYRAVQLRKTSLAYIYCVIFKIGITLGVDDFHQKEEG